MTLHLLARHQNVAAGILTHLTNGYKWTSVGRGDAEFPCPRSIREGLCFLQEPLDGTLQILSRSLSEARQSSVQCWHRWREGLRVCHRWGCAPAHPKNNRDRDRDMYRLYVHTCIGKYVWMDTWANGWMYGWRDGWMDECMYGTIM